MADASLKSLDSIGKPPEGVVRPPKDIQSIVEKTAGYVARNGPAFEDRIRQKEVSNPKFSFLDPSDEYHSFYAWRLEEVRSGRGTDVSAGRPGAAEVPEVKKPEGPPPPPDFEFSARMPNLNSKDDEVVKLTARFIAANGRAWMTQLSQRESGNPQFDFLRPQHSYNRYFQDLVEQYKSLMDRTDMGRKKEAARIALLNSHSKNPTSILDRARGRAEFKKHEEAQKVRKEEEAEAEKVAYAEIDWHDFVVVETIVFDQSDEQAELPPPPSKGDLQSASLEQKAMMSLQPTSMRIEEAMPTADDVPLFAAPPVQPPQQPAQAQPYIPQPSEAPQPSYPMPPPNMGHQETEEEQAIRERQEARQRAQQAQAAAKGPSGPMKIRNDYVPRAQARQQRPNMVICPNCKQQVPPDELEQHMRIEMLDPRWKEEKQKAEARFATTNLSTADVANNLKRLASQRTDVFDGVTVPAPTPEEEERRKRQATAQFFDGSSDQNPQKLQNMQHLNIQEQIQSLHQRYKQ